MSLISALLFYFSSLYPSWPLSLFLLFLSSCGRQLVTSKFYMFQFCHPFLSSSSSFAPPPPLPALSPFSLCFIIPEDQVLPQKKSALIVCGMHDHGPSSCMWEKGRKRSNFQEKSTGQVVLYVRPTNTTQIFESRDHSPLNHFSNFPSFFLNHSFSSKSPPPCSLTLSNFIMKMCLLELILTEPINTELRSPQQKIGGLLRGHFL